MTDSKPAANPPPGVGPFLLGLFRDWGLAVVVVLVVFAGYNWLFRPVPPPLGKAPDFSLSDLEGRSVQLSTVDDGLVILNFWFTTCPPCVREIPELSKFHAEHPEIPLYGVSTDGMPIGRLKQQADRLGVKYPVLHDARADVARDFGVDVFPTTVVVKDGEIVNARVGPVNREVLLAMVEGSR